jgi:hypothetical protein
MRGGNLQRWRQANPGTRNTLWSTNDPSFGTDRREAREGMGREDAPTVSGGKSLERRKPTRASASRPV